MKAIALVFLLSLSFLPSVSIAQSGVVPCNPKVVEGELVDECGICEAGQLVDNVADAFVGISGILVVILIIFGGLKLGLSGGDVSAKVSARKFIATAIFGYMVVLGAWMAVDTFLKFFTLDPDWGVWNPFECD